jgi:hypothetical protein
VYGIAIRNLTALALERNRRMLDDIDASLVRPR